MAPSHECIIISDATMWPPPRYSERLEPIRDWLSSNGIDPSEVAEQPVTVETLDTGQRIIRYTVYLRDKDGHRYVDPKDRNRAAQEERTTPLLAEPPADALPDHDHQASECRHCKDTRKKDQLLYMRLSEAVREKP